MSVESIERGKRLKTSFDWVFICWSEGKVIDTSFGVEYHDKINQRNIMEKLSIREYATKHKLSTFNVMKMTKSGELKTEIITEDGKETVLIMIEEVVEEKISQTIEKKYEPRSLKVENMLLKKEIVQLKEELEKCQKPL